MRDVLVVMTIGSIRGPKGATCIKRGGPSVSRPFLLLDVDGVLNPIGLQPSDLVPAGFDVHRLDGLRVLLAPEHGVWLRELSTAFKLVWATSWEHDANRLIGRGSACRTICR